MLTHLIMYLTRKRSVVL